MTLLEILVALVILALVLLATVGVQGAGLFWSRRGVQEMEAIRQGQAYLEALSLANLPTRCPTGGIEVELKRGVKARCESIPCALNAEGRLLCDSSLGGAQVYLARLRGTEERRFSLERVVGQ